MTMITSIDRKMNQSQACNNKYHIFIQKLCIAVVNMKKTDLNIST